VKKTSWIKKTLGKNGKYYHYESLGFVDDIKEVYWYRVSEDYYNFLVNSHKSHATKIDYNQNNEVVYMEYEHPKTTLSEHHQVPSVQNSGCLVLLLWTAVVSIIIVT
jgi:hypothetical protein